MFMKKIGVRLEVTRFRVTVKFIRPKNDQEIPKCRHVNMALAWRNQD